MKNKGYTLTELVCVIVILAIAVTLTLSAIVPQMLRARKTSFIDEANAISKAAINKYTTEEVHSNKSDDVYIHDDNDDKYLGRVCYNLSSLKDKYVKRLSDKYDGSIEVCYSSKCMYRTKIWLTNGHFNLNGARDVVIMSDLKDSPKMIHNCGNKK